jgi:hypothetical protein
MHMSLIRPPEAFLIADYSQEHEAFTASTDINEISRRFHRASRTPGVLLTDAERILNSFGSQLHDDDIGGEKYTTLYETHPVQGAYGSYHFMHLGAGGVAQEFHYHPPADKEMDSSVRHVLIFPLHNLMKPELSGITLEWFNVADPIISYKAKDPSVRIVSGTADEPLYQVHMKPGEVTLASFGAGTHRFKGHAIALSLHPLDIVHGNAGGSFLGNTAGWRGDIPRLARSVKKQSVGGVDLSSEGSLMTTFDASLRIFRSLVDKHGGAKLGQERHRELIADLRDATNIYSSPI